MCVLYLLDAWVCMTLGFFWGSPRSHMCTDCTLAWCTESCQKLQNDHAGCRCKDWPDASSSDIDISMIQYLQVTNKEDTIDWPPNSNLANLVIYGFH